MGFTGLQAAVTRNNETTQELHRCHSTWMMHMKNKLSEVISSSSANLRNKFKYSATKRGARMKNISMFNYFTVNSLEIYGSSTAPHCASLYTWLLQIWWSFIGSPARRGLGLGHTAQKAQRNLHLLFRWSFLALDGIVLWKSRRCLQQCMLSALKSRAPAGLPRTASACRDHLKPSDI